MQCQLCHVVVRLSCGFRLEHLPTLLSGMVGKGAILIQANFRRAAKKQLGRDSGRDSGHGQLISYCTNHPGRPAAGPENNWMIPRHAWPKLVCLTTSSHRVLAQRGFRRCHAMLALTRYFGIQRQMCHEDSNAIDNVTLPEMGIITAVIVPVVGPG
jgi:hypothetical protein